MMNNYKKFQNKVYKNISINYMYYKVKIFKNFQ